MKYKVGDRVRIKSLDWYNENKDRNGNVRCGEWNFTKWYTPYCGAILTIRFIWEDDECYKMIDSDHHWTDEMIEGLWEEETKPEPKFKAGNRVFNLSTKESVNIVEYDEETGLYTIIYDDGLKGRSFEDGLKRIEHITWDDVDEKTVSEKILEARDKYYWDMMGGETKNEITLPQGYQFVDENGNIINAQKIVLEKKKKEYPKTYEECAEIIAELTGSDCNPKGCMGYMSVQLTALQKLLICRDAYWKIAGEEMELGKPWEPDWKNDEQFKYVIICRRNCIIKDTFTAKDVILAFPTAEMRDAFKENFDSDIEICKEFL